MWLYFPHKRDARNWDAQDLHKRTHVAFMWLFSHSAQHLFPICRGRCKLTHVNSRLPQYLTKDTPFFFQKFLFSAKFGCNLTPGIVHDTVISVWWIIKMPVCFVLWIWRAPLCPCRSENFLEVWDTKICVKRTMGGGEATKMTSFIRTKSRGPRGCVKLRPGIKHPVACTGKSSTNFLCLSNQQTAGLLCGAHLDWTLGVCSEELDLWPHSTEAIRPNSGH